MEVSWAPERWYRPSITKCGTPVTPAACSFSSCLTCSQHASFQLHACQQGDWPEFALLEKGSAMVPCVALPSLCKSMQDAHSMTHNGGIIMWPSTAHTAHDEVNYHASALCIFQVACLMARRLLL